MGGTAEGAGWLRSVGRGCGAELEEGEPGGEEEDEGGGDEAGEIAAALEGEEGVAEAIGQFEERPEPHQAASGRPILVDGDGTEPQAEGDKDRVDDGKAEREIVAKEATDEAGGGEDVVDAGDIFFDGVGGLGNDQAEENELGAAGHGGAAGMVVVAEGQCKGGRKFQI